MEDTIELATETLVFVSSSILLWDHLITLDKEITHIWIRKKSISSFWFFSVRYFGLTGNIPVLLFSFMTLPPNQYSFVHQILLLANQLLICAVMILRTYAFYGRDRRLLGSLIVISACLLAVCAWNMQGQHMIPVTVYPGYLSASWAALLLFDSLILALTLFKTYHTHRHVGSANLPIHSLIARDGHLVLRSISVSMTSRLMLNLHEKTTIGILSQTNEISVPLEFRNSSEG
ncbi:hypothetical protein FB451DRAFT_1288658 [Mycena latifolia]|nr:hypothetical protein FB451DRAFT_1288658 [Mycena latifolia]